MKRSVSIDCWSVGHDMSRQTTTYTLVHRSFHPKLGFCMGPTSPWVAQKWVGSTKVGWWQSIGRQLDHVITALHCMTNHHCVVYLNTIFGL